MGFGSQQTRGRRSPLRAALAFATAAGLALGGLTIGATVSHAKGGPDDITIVDDDLRTYLNRNMQGGSGVARADDADITVAEAAAFPSTRQINLEPGGIFNTGEISSLVGLEYFVQVDDVWLNDQPITDLTPLLGLPLDVINISGTQVSALPAGAWSGSLRQLNANDLPSLTSFGDLTAYSALKQVLAVDSGISSLVGLPAGIEFIQVGSTNAASPSQIDDLSPLQHANLKHLLLVNTKVGDLSPLQGHNFSNGFIAIGGEIIDLSPIDNGVQTRVINQTAVVASVAVDAPFANPVKDVDGSAVAVTSTDAGFSFDAAANSWSFSTPGEKTLTYSASDANGEYFSGTITQTVTEGAIVPPAAGPQIAGTPQVGQQLTVDLGIWQPADATLAVEWLVDGTPVAGETSTTFTPRAADAGKTVSVRVTASKAGYAPQVETSAVVQIAVPAITANKTKAKVGEQVTFTGAHFAPGENIEIVLHSNPITLGTVQANAQGAFTATYTIPAQATVAANHRVVATGQTTGLSAQVGFEVLAASGNAGAGSNSGQLSQTGFDGSPVFITAAAVLLMLGAGLGAAQLIAKRRVG